LIGDPDDDMLWSLANGDLDGFGLAACIVLSLDQSLDGIT
jgi:hypothetical protein